MMRLGGTCKWFYFITGTPESILHLRQRGGDEELVCFPKTRKSGVIGMPELYVYQMNDDGQSVADAFSTKYNPFGFKRKRKRK